LSPDTSDFSFGFSSGGGGVPLNFYAGVTMASTALENETGFDAQCRR
jgi:hypothetical protein